MRAADGLFDELPPMTVVLGGSDADRTNFLHLLYERHRDLAVYFRHDRHRSGIVDGRAGILDPAPILDSSLLFTWTVEAGGGRAPELILDQDADYPRAQTEPVPLARLIGFRNLAADTGGRIVLAFHTVDYIPGLGHGVGKEAQAGTWADGADQWVLLPPAPPPGVPARIHREVAGIRQQRQALLWRPGQDRTVVLSVPERTLRPPDLIRFGPW